jgi:GntR family transcriptional regulator/MocR family aminotransferase
MVRNGRPAVLAPPLDAKSAVPLHRQLYDGVRHLILQGNLAAGARLPSTRSLALDLGVSRNTVSTAFEQLWAEGYVEGKLGSGTYVSRVLPDHLLQVPARPRAEEALSRRPGLSRRGRMLTGTPVSISHLAPVRPFQPGLPALGDFPGETWGRLLIRRWRARTPALMGYGDPAGHRPLREAIVTYLAGARGVQCRPEQVIVVSGSQQALDFAAHLLLDPGDGAWIEEPGYLGARAALLGAGARLAAVPADAEGINPTRVAAADKKPRLIYVTPSHQYPLGVTMSLARRLALLDAAAQAGAWVLEDDYDSEYRYASRPLAALQGLDRQGRVIYLGTFSKVLFPALRLGYLVVPEDLTEGFIAAHALADRHCPSLVQAVLADFIADGHFARHLRRMRTLYAERQEALVKSARRELGGLLEVEPGEAGMHLVGWLPENVDDRVAARAAAEAGVTTAPLSAYRMGAPGRGGLLLGYAAFPPRDIRDGVRRLAGALGGVARK